MPGSINTGPFTRGLQSIWRGCQKRITLAYIIRALSYRPTSDAEIGFALRVDAIDGVIVNDETDVEHVGLMFLLGVVCEQLAVATETTSGPAECTGDGGEFCGVKEPGLVTVILGAVLL